MRLCSLSLFVVLHTISNGSRYGNIEAMRAAYKVGFKDGATMMKEIQD